MNLSKKFFVVGIFIFAQSSLAIAGAAPVATTPKACDLALLNNTIAALESDPTTAGSTAACDSQGQVVVQPNQTAGIEPGSPGSQRKLSGSAEPVSIPGSPGSQ